MARMLDRPLTRLERKFATSLVADPERSVARAAKAGGYRDRKEGYRALQRPHVQRYIQALEEKARRGVKIRPVRAEVVPMVPTKEVRAVTTAMATDMASEQHAIASRAEILAMATNVVRTHESRRLGDLYKLTDGPDPTLVADAAKMAELPLAAVKGLRHDHAGDLELKLADPLAAARLILDDHHRAQEGARSQGGVDLASALVQVLREAALRERKPVTSAPAQRPRVAESPGTRRIP